MQVSLQSQGRAFMRSQLYIIHKVAPRNYRYAIQIENLVFVY